MPAVRADDNTFDYIPVAEEPPWPDEPAIGGRPRPARSGTKPLVALDWAAIMAEPDEPVPTLIPGIPKVGLAVLAGSPKVGKSLFLTQTATPARLSESARSSWSPA
ncbi:MAG: hypothetical protein ABSG37_04190 [Candidatus Limnocylindrales bacterium]|jgi:hypothetical protein